MRRRHARRPACCAALLLALGWAAVALGHGASRGLHLHLSPDPAKPGSKITLEIEAAEPMRQIRAALGDVKTPPHELDPPRRRFELRLRVPAGTATETVNAHAEVKTVSGKTLRAAAVLRIERGQRDEGGAVTAR